MSSQKEAIAVAHDVSSSESQGHHGTNLHSFVRQSITADFVRAVSEFCDLIKLDITTDRKTVLDRESAELLAKCDSWMEHTATLTFSSNPSQTYPGALPRRFFTVTASDHFHREGNNLLKNSVRIALTEGPQGTIIRPIDTAADALKCLNEYAAKLMSKEQLGVFRDVFGKMREQSNRPHLVS
jgi:hypothetical protein